MAISVARALPLANIPCLGACACRVRPRDCWLVSPPTTSGSTALENADVHRQENSDAKTRICAAVDTTHKGVVLQSGANKQGAVSSDPALAEGQSANARLSIISGSWYLRDHLDPATPQPLANTIRHLSTVMLDIGANYLAGAEIDGPSPISPL